MHHYDAEKEKVDAELDEIHEQQKAARNQMKYCRPVLTVTGPYFSCPEAKKQYYELEDRLDELKAREKTTRAQWYSFRQWDETHNASLNAYLAEKRNDELVRAIKDALSDLASATRGNRA